MTNEELIFKAEQARKYSKCKYTKYSVGAALLTSSGKVYTGCNIEHSISGLASCAERVAFMKAVSEGEDSFEKIAVVGGYQNQDKEAMLIPCMVCVQYMLDFVDDIKVVCYIDSKIEELHLTDPRLLSLNVNRKVKMKKFDRKENKQ